jgi:hypothetical protein
MKIRPGIISVVVFSAVFACAACIHASSIASGAGTSSFPFLKINVGARAVGMGGAFTGLADDEASLYYNPAGITSVSGNRYMLEYLNYFEDMQSGLVGFVHPISETRFFAAHINYLNYGKFIQTDNLGTVTGDFGGGDLAIAGTYAMKLREYFAVGATAKFIYEKVQNYSATGVALDLGAKYISDRSRYTAGVMVQNLGFQLSALGTSPKEKLPLTFRVGGGAIPKGLPIQFVGDLIMPVDNKISVALGAEYRSLKPLYLRVGWNSFGSNYRIQGSSDSWAGISFGVGFDYKKMRLSYAYSPAADLGQCHRITLTGSI